MLRGRKERGATPFPPSLNSVWELDNNTVIFGPLSMRTWYMTARLRKNGSQVGQNRPGIPDIHCGGHLASLSLPLRALGLVFAMFLEADKNGLVLRKAWQKWVTGEPKQTRDARHLLLRTSGITVLASEGCRSHCCHVLRGRQKWISIT